MRGNTGFQANVRVVRRKRRLNKPRFFLTLLLIFGLGFLTYYVTDYYNIGLSIPIFSADDGSKTVGSNPGSTKGNTQSSTSSTGTTDEPAGTATSVPPTASPKPPKDFSKLKGELEAYIANYKGQYGIYFLDLVSPENNFGINDTDEYVAASTVKIPINLYLFEKIRNGTVDPESKMTYLSGDYEGGTGSIQYKKVGSTFTIRKLSELSIEQSDNVATNMLLRLLKRQNVKDYMRSLGGVAVDDSRNISCPKDMALYMNAVYDFSENNSELGDELMGYLENTIFNDRIPKLLPKDVVVAHKIGNQVGALHDVGVVYTEKPYVISIMTKGITESEAYDVIANISRKVYDFAADR